ncbi:hypothetical protein LTR53_016064 [Teratosphaeriaceae sp. CCFEE 6253]|nr:hypothetical protein LTR53_016064 [Teratosphaeriaceae sp. CCFEE 6253]
MDWNPQAPHALPNRLPLDFKLEECFIDAACNWLNSEALMSASPPATSPPTSMESQSPPRLEITPVVPSRERRKEQNRAAQRAFRERNIKRVDDLKADVVRLTTSLAALQKENVALRRAPSRTPPDLAVASLQHENAALKRNIARMSTDLVKAKDAIAMLRIVRHAERHGSLGSPNDLDGS